MDVMTYLQRRVSELRERRGWSQHELSYRAGVPQPTIWRLEHGKIQNVSVVVVRRLAKAFGVGVDYLVGTDEPDVEIEPAAVAEVGA
jgi:transcriptional regulator with XRE-family HTH domain